MRLVFAREKTLYRRLGNFPFDNIKSDVVADMLAFETLSLSCLENVYVGEGPEGALTFSFPDFAKQITSDRSLVPLLRKSENPVGGKIADALRSLSGIFIANDQAMRVLFEEARSKRVGYYTLEQEADELSGEWVADVGLNPSAAVEMALDLSDLMAIYRPGSVDPFDVSAVDCRKLYSRGWKTEDGQPYLVPIGDFEDPHHSPCFRAYNLSREIDAHAYKVSEPASDLPNAEGATPWKELQILTATALGEQEAPAIAPPEMSEETVEALRATFRASKAALNCSHDEHSRM